VFAAGPCWPTSLQWCRVQVESSGAGIRWPCATRAVRGSFAHRACHVRITLGKRRPRAAVPDGAG
jgi:hypothetical protein